MKFVVLAVAAALCGCTTSQQADNLLAGKYLGKSTDSFFTRHGPPASSYKLNNGDTMFTWAETARYWSSSGSVTTQVYGNTAISTVSAPERHLQQCQLKILAGPSGTIKDISVLSDSLGVWQMSRCNEYFSKR